MKNSKIEIPEVTASIWNFFRFSDASISRHGLGENIICTFVLTFSQREKDSGLLSQSHEKTFMTSQLTCRWLAYSDAMCFFRPRP